MFSFNKDAFIHVFSGDLIHVFHRPVFERVPPSLWYGTLPLDSLEGEFRGLVVENNSILMVPADFEYNIGWGAPFLKIDDKYIAIAHARGVDEVYRLYVVELEEDEEGFGITGISPYYVMEPKEVYEKYGDRPYVVFICGADIVDDEILISYGAADTFIAFAEVDIPTLLGSIKKIR